MSKRKLDTDKIARGLKARKKGTVYPTGGYPGAAQLAAEVQARFRVPPGGGRPTDPRWSDKRLHEETGVRIEPMQLAAILLETAIESVGAEEAERLVTSHRRSDRS